MSHVLDSFSCNGFRDVVVWLLLWRRGLTSTLTQPQRTSPVTHATPSTLPDLLVMGVGGLGSEFVGPAGEVGGEDGSQVVPQRREQPQRVQLGWLSRACRSR